MRRWWSSSKAAVGRCCSPMMKAIWADADSAACIARQLPKSFGQQVRRKFARVGTQHGFVNLQQACDALPQTVADRFRHRKGEHPPWNRNSKEWPPG